MRKVLLNRPFVAFLALWMFLIGLPPRAMAMPSASLEVSNVSARQADLNKVLAVLSRPEARAHLALMGIRREELASRLSELDDRELSMVARKAEAVKAGGDALGVVVVLLVIAILVVLLVKLSNKTVEIKDQR